MSLEDTLNNQMSNAETPEFRKSLLNFWNEEEFRHKTYQQLSKDFSLSGINLQLDSLVKCTSQYELEILIDSVLTKKNTVRLLYIVDLKDYGESHPLNLSTSIITRVAFKVFFRTHFDCNRSC